MTLQLFLVVFDIQGKKQQTYVASQSLKKVVEAYTDPAVPIFHIQKLGTVDIDMNDTPGD